MVIHTNKPSLNAARHLNKNQKKSSENLEKLASGFKINSADDDAAGLGISEKMRAQITSLDTYSCNVEDGINLVQTADGYMDEIHGMLNRLVELSEKASNGIYEDNERKCIQEEVDQLSEETDRICETANFNGNPLFRGTVYIRYITKRVTHFIEQPPVYKGGIPKWLTIDNASDGSGQLKDHYTDDNGVRHAASYLDMSSFTGSSADIAAGVNTGIYTTCCTCDRHYSIRFTDKASSSREISEQHFIYNVGLAGAKNADDVYKRIINAMQPISDDAANPEKHFTNLLIKDGKLIVYDNRPCDKTENGVVIEDGNYAVPHGNSGLLGKGYAEGVPPIKEEHDEVVPVERFNPKHIMINAGEYRPGKIHLSLPTLSTYELNIEGLSVMSAEDANKSMGLVKEAINHLSLCRGALGAQQNRMEHTINNINTAYENISAARSRIKDTDMAKEMAEYTKNNVLTQTAQAMLAHANTRPQDVLQLLQ